MTRTRKTILSAAIGLASLFLLLGIAGLLILRSDWFRDQVRQRVVREVESATGGRAEIGELAFDWRRLRGEVRPFVLHGTEKPGEPPLFTAGSVEIGLKIVSILQREVNIASLAVTQPRVYIAVYEDGRTNLPQPQAARRQQNPVAQVLALSIGRFDVQNGLLDVNQKQIPLDVRGENLSARLFYESAAPRYTGEVSFRRLNLASPSFLPVALDADISLDLESDRLVVRKARFATERSSAAVSGAVENLLSPRVRLTVDARLWLAEVETLAKLPPSAQGMLQLAGELFFASRSDYRLSARITGANLSARAAGMSLRNIRFSSQMLLDPRHIELKQVSTSSPAGVFSGRVELERPGRFRLGGEIRDVSIAEVAALRGMQAPPWNGRASGPISVEGVWASGAPRDLKLGAKLNIAPAEELKPLEGFLDVTLDQRAGTLQFADSHLATAASRLQFSGTLGRSLNVDFESKNPEEILPAASLVSKHAPQQLPVTLRHGSARFKGKVEGELLDPRVSGHVSLLSFVYDKRSFDRLETDVAASRTSLEFGKLVLDQGGAVVQGRGRVALADWKPLESSRISGAFTLRGLSLERLAAEAGAKARVRGNLSGSVQAAGTLSAPQVVANLNVGPAEAFGQRIDRATTRVRYASKTLSVEAVELHAGTALLRGSAEYTPRAEDWRSGALRFNLSAAGVRLRDWRAPLGIPEQWDGDLDAQFKGAASAADTKLLLSDLQGKIRVEKLAFEGRVAGSLVVNARTQGETLDLDGGGQLLGVKVSGQARCLLQGRYPFGGEVRFGRISLSALRPWLVQAGHTAPLPEASADGSIAFKGAGLDPDSWSARVELPAVEILPPPNLKSPVPGLHNEGLVVLAVSRKEIRIVGAHFTGLDTNVDASGRIDLATRSNAYNVRLSGGINLAILRTLDPNLTASGESTLDASVRGPLSRPEVYGRLDLKKASLYLSNIPNGLDNVNGTVFLFRDRATIENLSAETGGGKLALSGFVGYGEERLSYRLQAAATSVRIRYPPGVSTTVDAALDLTGTSSRSLLSGSVTILRSGVSANTDLASLLAPSSQPLITPAAENELLRGMQFQVKIVTAPNARFDTALARGVLAEADLRLQGTPYKPVLLGRISVHQGEINFMGNRYTIARGEVSFLNPVKLEPILDLDLSTRVRGIDVTMNFTGPLDRLNATYRSDPPLQVQEIIALLAVGRAPTSDPALLARQSAQTQGWEQLGANTIIGQALAAPVANRLQRFFGVSQIKIDPQLTGVGSIPEAQLTLQQQISSDITFTYVTSLAREQSQLIAVEWNVSRQWSVQAVRQENGLFGIEFRYRRQFR